MPTVKKTVHEDISTCLVPLERSTYWYLPDCHIRYLWSAFSATARDMTGPNLQVQGGHQCVVSIVGSFQPLLQLLLIIIGSASSSRIYNRQHTLITGQPNIYNLSSSFCSGLDLASKWVSVARYIHNGRLEQYRQMAWKWTVVFRYCCQKKTHKRDQWSKINLSIYIWLAFQGVCLTHTLSYTCSFFFFFLQFHLLLQNFQQEKWQSPKHLSCSVW